jgi:hypothetical protein
MTTAMTDPTMLPLKPSIPLRDGRIIRSIGDAIALVREHEARPGIDDRDEVLHHLERAHTDSERRLAAAEFVAWAKELDLLLGRGFR